MEQEYIKLIRKSEWFEFRSPLGEPDIKWPKERWDDKYIKKEPNTYTIERVVSPNGDISWLGQGTNWIKKQNEGWTYLGVDENIKPIVFIKGEDGFGDYSEYPEGRLIFIPCEPPIYEVIYSNLKQNNQSLI